jgi:hypothetical protein
MILRGEAATTYFFAMSTQGLCKFQDSSGEKEFARVTDDDGRVKTISEGSYRVLGYRPAFDKLPDCKPSDVPEIPDV